MLPAFARCRPGYLGQVRVVPARGVRNKPRSGDHRDSVHDMLDAEDAKDVAAKEETGRNPRDTDHPTGVEQAADNAATESPS